MCREGEEDEGEDEERDGTGDAALDVVVCASGGRVEGDNGPIPQKAPRGHGKQEEGNEGGSIGEEMKLFGERCCGNRIRGRWSVTY